MFYFYLQIDQETDVTSCNTVSGTALELWKDPVARGPGPSLENVIFDWVGGRKSDWNETLINLLAQKMKSEAQENWTYLPKYDLFYWQETIWRKFRNLCAKWNRAQCLRKRDGSFETAEGASARLLAQQKKERKLARENTRRHSVRKLCMLKSFRLTTNRNTSHGVAFAPPWWN